MLIRKVYVEQDVLSLKQTQLILNHPKIKDLPRVMIPSIDLYFGKVHKPYLQKRNSLNLFLGQKKGTLVKEAPNAYGQAGNPHYYFIHAYNCPFECDYCYLQGHFSSPDLVLFVNHEEMAKQIREITLQSLPGVNPWFHAGEFSDSLALAHISQELPTYFELFMELKTAKLELRTKSANVAPLLAQNPLPNIITSFSLSSIDQAQNHDHNTSQIKARITALAKLQQANHPVAIHLDPIIYENNFLENYHELLKLLSEKASIERLEYVSLGVVRFTKSVYRQMQLNYPKSSIHGPEFITSFDNKVRYKRPLRMWMMRELKKLLIQYGLPEKKIYLCMENDTDKEIGHIHDQEKTQK